MRSLIIRLFILLGFVLPVFITPMAAADELLLGQTVDYGSFTKNVSVADYISIQGDVTVYVNGTQVFTRALPQSDPNTPWIFPAVPFSASKGDVLRVVATSPPMDFRGTNFGIDPIGLKRPIDGGVTILDGTYIRGNGAPDINGYYGWYVISGSVDIVTSAETQFPDFSFLSASTSYVYYDKSFTLKSFQSISYDGLVSWGALPPLATGTGYDISATATSGLPVSITSSTPNICSVEGNRVLGIAGGGCLLTASQPGDSNFYAIIGARLYIPISGDPALKDPTDNEKTNSNATGTDANAPGQCSPPSTASKDPVDLSTGFYYDNLEQLAISAAGAPLQMSLSYSSGNTISGNTGFGWRHPYQYSVVVNPQIISHPDSARITWPDGHVSYVDNWNGTTTDRRQKTYNFDAHGKLVSTIDRLGFVRNLTYLANGNLDKVTDALFGRFLQFGYDAQSRVTSVASAGAGTVALAYDANGDLVSVTDALGNVTSFTYDANHRLLTKVNALGAAMVTNTYDPVTGRVISQDDGLANTPLEQFTYTVADSGNILTTDYQHGTGGITKQIFDPTSLSLQKTIDPVGGAETHTVVAGKDTDYIDPLNNQTRFTYDASGYILSRTDAQGGVASYTYDAEHNITRSTDEAGNVTTMTYAPNHQLLSTTDLLGNVTTNTYNAQGLLATVTAAKGGVTSYTYDVQGNLTSMTDPAGMTTGYTYDAAGRMLTRTNGAGNVWTWAYDLMGHVLLVADPLGHTTSYTYDALGRIATKTSPGGGITRHAYDIHGNLTSLTDPLGAVTAFAYDADDHLMRTTDALGHITTITRDAKGRVTSTTDALGHITSNSYNAADDVTVRQDAQNYQTGFAYDSLRRLTTTTDALSHNTSLAYDAASRVTGRTDAKGNATGFGYDALGQMVSATNALRGSATQTFDPNGNRISFTDANGNATTFTLDTANRITDIATADGGATHYTYNNQSRVATATNGRGQVATYTYDTAGQLVTLADPAGTTTFTYDADGNILTVGDAVGTSSFTYDLLNRITGYTDVYGNHIGYAYNAVGNLTTLTYPGNKTVAYAYDAANRMVSVTDWSGHITSYTYDARGNMTAVARANGTHGAYAYDAQGQVTSIAETTTGNASLYAIELGYDGNGNITSETTIPATTPPVIAATNMTGGTDNRLATANGQSVIYDADGNMTSGPLNGATSAYSFDARSRLTGIGASSYIYDAQGNRVSATNAGAVTRYVVDPNAALPRVLMETDAAGTPIAYYVYGMGLISRESAGATYQTYHYDLRGSTLKLVDATGTVTDSYRYGSYGEPLNITTGAIAGANTFIGVTANPFRYNGRDGVMTEANGLYYMRARYYLPEARRFVSRDTLLGSVGQMLTLNRFAYVNGNPVGFVDPGGLAPDAVKLITDQTMDLTKKYALPESVNALLGKANKLGSYLNDPVNAGLCDAAKWAGKKAGLGHVGLLLDLASPTEIGLDDRLLEQAKFENWLATTPEGKKLREAQQTVNSSFPFVPPAQINPNPYNGTSFRNGGM